MTAGDTTIFLLAWAALMALLMATIGVSFLNLGAWNVVLNMAIAAGKVGIIAWVYMHLRHSFPLVRLAAVLAILWLAILFMLGLSDYLTR